MTNAIIERRGALTGMLTTEGFEDVIEIGLGERYDMYDLFLPFPEPLVERRLRLGVPGRIGADGAELAPLDEAAVVDALRSLAAEGIEAVAICFLHAHANPTHERRVAELARDHVPQLAVSCSSDIGRVSSVNMNGSRRPWRTRMSSRGSTDTSARSTPGFRTVAFF